MPVMTRRVRTTRATQPNAGVKHWYQQRLDELIAGMYLDLTLQLGLVFTRESAKIEPKVTSKTRIASDAGISAVDKTMKTWARKWTLKFDKLSLDLSKRFARRAFGVTEASVKDAFKAAGFTVKFKPTRAGLEAYKAVVSENVNLIKSIPQEFLTNVQSSVWSSVRVGGDMGVLSRKLRANYDVTTKRAALIARDQNAKATAVIENTRRQELGITQAIWQHSAGGKEPRPTHVEMDGKLFDLKRGMWDSDEEAYVFPGQLINCRCTSRAVIPGFED
jgi:SPP1 gp7 family putative phage head morphogenesis protein